ncbi:MULTISPECIES: hypothetical protein [unclassified Xanthomonas]|uniref:hypothetical protein n=2 Tax=Xanthomonas TaxID=338 RepID=UPI002882F106|nr:MULTISPECIES: hypothetical protein [unclassified Xanthomonas]
MMTTMQRDAIARAQRGDWELADAMELACLERMTFNGAYALLFGIWEGGRLRRFAYGEACDDDADMQFVNDSVRLIVDLNGNVLQRAEIDHELDSSLLSSVERTRLWANSILSEYLATLPAPTQAPLIPETV